jgi:hypothetical protein
MFQFLFGPFYSVVKTEVHGIQERLKKFLIQCTGVYLKTSENVFLYYIAYF